MITELTIIASESLSSHFQNQIGCFHPPPQVSLPLKLPSWDAKVVNDCDITPSILRKQQPLVSLLNYQGGRSNNG